MKIKELRAILDATPEEIKLVQNIIKQIKTNEKTKGFTWNYGKSSNN